MTCSLASMPPQLTHPANSAHRIADTFNLYLGDVAVAEADPFVAAAGTAVRVLISAGRVRLADAVSLACRHRAHLTAAD
jgi:hypothetical protein